VFSVSVLSRGRFSGGLSENSVKPLFKRFKRFEKSLYSKTAFQALFVKPLFKRFQRFESVFSLGALRSDRKTAFQAV
jgi:hypothetical protein